jgi:hypothetical protein
MKIQHHQMPMFRMKIQHHQLPMFRFTLKQL